MKSNYIFTIIVLVIWGLFTQSCEDIFEPPLNNFYEESRILKDAAFAEGILLTSYAALPASYRLNEVATDDAVSNISNNFRRLATGEWSSQFNPESAWDNAYKQLYSLNYFLSVVDNVQWSWESNTRNALFRDRFTGEAKALRAWYNFELLKKHGGLSSEGEPLGFVITKPEYLSNIGEDSLRKLPRDSYNDCVQFILDDLNEAISLLPDEYEDVAGESDYNLVFGSQNKNRINGKAVKALKARFLLHIASQPFYEVSDKWEVAAAAAADLLSDLGGVSGLSPTGIEWYKNKSDREIIWRDNFRNINSWEKSNFPPSLFGNGQTNPSQNLVDAFPMANGYPINHSQSGYNSAQPYIGRDKRLQAYIVYDGSKIGTKIINTGKESVKDGINNTPQSTRTGYYLKKLFNENVNLDPNIMSTAEHFYTFFRYTEVFLIYAEAANEAWGPSSDPKGYGFTAKDVIAALRKRAQISQPDQYLVSVSTSKDLFRELVRNERRIELCFEDFRFWDIRRWDLDLNTPAKGMLISNGTFDVINVENRSFRPYMKYGPIPYDEILKNPNLKQNAGW